MPKGRRFSSQPQLRFRIEALPVEPTAPVAWGRVLAWCFGLCVVFLAYIIVILWETPPPYGSVRETTLSYSSEASMGGDCIQGFGKHPPFPLPSETLVDHIVGLADVGWFYLNYIRNFRPAVLHGTLENSSAMFRWTDSHLWHTLYDEPVEVHDFPREYRPTDIYKWTLKNRTFHEFWSMVHVKGSKSLAGYYTFDIFATATKRLARDIQPPTYIPCAVNPTYSRKSVLMLSYADQKTLLKNSVQDMILVQVVGYSTLNLINGSTASAFLYEAHAGTEHATKQSLVDSFDPDYDLFPLFVHAHPMQILLKPGDAVYIPGMWWHQSVSSCRAVQLQLQLDVRGAVRLSDEVLRKESPQVIQHLRQMVPMCDVSELDAFF
eukprot:NODE_2128_length_1286_cov_36.692805_g1936_i0.p1 GENE.NODE_2128_length_1286_cov_36.692805_g1936_i0~~NODE_2128_length_1286_cov_36.692805_g1936_i0.p1  ORF type:complete len:378 (+),score=54.27 NODE_2128_length_1286_cov_36.692805_g1936_i0:85-1218(+)